MRDGASAKVMLGRRATESSSKASTTTTTVSEATTRRETTTSAKAATEAATSTKGSTRGKSTSTGKTILANLKLTSLPIVTVELGDCVAGIFRSLKGDNTAALGTTVRTNMDIGANNGT